jgi:hypothetical protein
MNVQPLFPPALNGVGKFDIKIVDFRPNTYNNAANIVGDVVVAIAANAKDAFPQGPIGLDPEKALTECDKNRNVEERVGRQMMQLKPIDKKETMEKFVDWGRKSSDEVVNETNPIVDWRLRVALLLGELERVLLLVESHLL